MSKAYPGIQVKGGTPNFHPSYGKQSGFVPQAVKQDPPEEPKLKEEDIAEIKRFISGFTPLSDGAVLVLRHSLPKKIGAIWTPNQAREDSKKLTLTGTVISATPVYHLPNGEEVEAKVQTGDIIGFSPYAPFAAYPKYPQLQLLHLDELLFKLDEMPPEVEEPFEFSKLN